MSETSPFAINFDNISTEAPDEQIQEETVSAPESVTPEEFKLDLPTNDYKAEPAFETVEIQDRPKVTQEQQVEALVNNYLTTHPNLYLTGKQKRNMRRVFERDVKKGKYEKIFNPTV